MNQRSPMSVSWTLIDTRRAWSLARFHVVPLAFACLVIVAYLDPSLASEATTPGLRPIDGWWLVAGLVSANALAFRRWAPLASLAVVSVVVGWVGLAPYPLPPIAWMVYVSAFALGRYGPARHGPAGFVLFTGAIVATWFSDQGLTVGGVGFVYAFGIMSWLAGRELGRWRGRAELERVLADRRVELERQEVELAIVQQRLHIANELHDVVAHSLGLIAVQAGMADAAFDAKPDEAKRAVRNIVETSRSSLTEIRQILGVLRTGGDEPAAARLARHASAPQLGDVTDLIAATEAQGLEVTAELALPAALPAGLQLSAYRIVQQALSNVVEHAGASAVLVRVTGRDGVLEIEVLDDGRGLAVGRSGGDRGFGLVGMRERVATYGGVLDVGPGHNGGFLVRARMPYGRPDDPVTGGAVTGGAVSGAVVGAIGGRVSAREVRA